MEFSCCVSVPRGTRHPVTVASGIIHIFLFSFQEQKWKHAQKAANGYTNAPALQGGEQDSQHHTHMHLTLYTQETIPS